MRQFIARGERELSQVAKLIDGLSPDKPWRIAVTPYRSKRSPEANRLLWALYTEIARETGHTAEEIHDVCKSLHLPPRFVKVGGETVKVAGSTADLDVPSFSEYVERVQAWAASELAIQL